MSQRELTPSSTILRIFKIIGDIIWDMRAPLIISVLAFIVFFVPPQVEEIYKVLALEAMDTWYRPILSLLLLAALSYFLWSMSRSLWANSVDINPQITFSPLARGISHIFSFIIAMLPIIGVLLAMIPEGLSLEAIVALIAPFTSSMLGLSPQPAEIIIDPNFATLASVTRDLSAADAGELPKYTTDLVKIYEPVANNLILAIQGVVVFFLLMALFLIWRAFRKGSRFAEKPFAPKYFFPIIAILAVIIALVAAQPVIQSVGGSQFLVTWVITGIGSFGIICIFLISLTYLLAGATRVYDVVGIPAVTILVSAALIFAFFGLNNNHKVRLKEANTKSEKPELMFEEFLSWYESIPADRIKKYSGNENYPVYIITARGGGVYAANLAALTLARLYTACPALRHHVFAISAVSGGSLGASTFNAFWQQARLANSPEVSGEDCALVPRTDGQPSELETNIRTYLRHDFLSPVLSGALFPDFMQRFFVPGFGALDRARAFETSLNHAWIDTARVSGIDLGDSRPPFKKGFLRFNEEARRVGAPALVLNTTSVETGERFAVAPFRKGDPYVPMSFVHPIEWLGEDGKPKKYDISLATAVSLSSRFPFILPPGDYPQRQGRTFLFDERSLVDGGYFESSAIDTAVDLVKAIKEQLDALKVKDPYRVAVDPQFRFIVLNDAYSSNAAPRDFNEEVSEFGAPVITLNRTRYRRGELAEWRVRREPDVEKVYFIQLHHGDFDIPLGWHLSKATQDMISAQIGYPSDCRDLKTVPVLDVDRDRLDPELAFVLDRRPGEALRNLIEDFNSNRCELKEIITELEPKKAKTLGLQ